MELAILPGALQATGKLARRDRYCVWADNPALLFLIQEVGTVVLKSDWATRARHHITIGKLEKQFPPGDSTTGRPTPAGRGE